MDIKRGIAEAASGALGNIEKAIIEIIDCRKREVVKDAPVFAGGGKAPALGKSTGSLVLADTTMAKLTKNGILDNSYQKIGTTRKFFYVQFNPSELSLSGYGGGMMPVHNFAQNPSGEGKDSSAMKELKVRITMDIKLIFDHVNVKDAFMAERLNTAPTAVTTGMVQAGLKLANKLDYSVQKEVEGFIAALRCPSTRKINFYWGDMFYGGILHGVSSQYTMFNLDGEPIRGEVHLSLTCADEEISELKMGRWQKQYQKAFQNQSQSYVKNAQKVGNLLNFNI